MDAPEKDVQLEPGGVHPRDQHHHGEDELEDLRPADVTHLALVRRNGGIMM